MGNIQDPSITFINDNCGYSSLYPRTMILRTDESSLIVNQIHF